MVDIVAPRNPQFLGADYLARGRVYDETDRKQAFTITNRVVPFRGWVQRWSMTIPLIDERGQLIPRILRHQEIHQQHTAFDVPVPQNPYVSDQIGAGQVVLSENALARTNGFDVDIPATITLHDLSLIHI